MVYTPNKYRETEGIKVRAIGYDLSQAKLEATALQLGITKSVSAMTQAEKAQLRYYAIMTQVTVAQGDMARTLEDPANQMRVFRAQVNMTAREIGNVFIPALNAILPYAIAVTKVVGTLASTIAGLVGYKPKEFDKATENVTENTENLQDNLQGAQEEAKKLKSYMLGIDELNVINPNSETDDPSGWVDFDLPDYSDKFLSDLAESKVAIIVEDMKEWLGITVDINTWTELLDTRLGHILITVGAIGTAFAAWKIGAGVATVLGVIPWGTLGSALGSALGAIATPAGAAVAAILAVATALGVVYFTNEDVRKSVNKAVEDIGKSFAPMLEFLSKKVLPDLSSAWNRLVKILTPLGEWLASVFVSIWNDILIPILQAMSSTIIPTLTETFVNLWNNVLVPLASFLGDVFEPIISYLCDILTMMWTYVILPLADAIGGTFIKAWQGVYTILNESIYPIFQGLIMQLEGLWNDVLAPIVNFLWDVFLPVFEEVFKGIQGIIDGLSETLGGLIDFVVGIFTSDWETAWKGIKQIFSGIWNTFDAVMRTPFNMVIALLESLANKVIDAWNGIKRAINSISIDLPEWLGGGTFGLNLKMSEHISIPRFAEGGFPEQGQMFIAREAGAEMVGNIGRRTAVANNDQIVAGIAGGVAEANEEQNALLREQNSLLMAILEKESGVYLDGKRLTNSVEGYQRERGRVLITGGVL